MAFATMGLEAACARGFLAGKTVLLTGPTAGLGAAIVDELCMLGPNKPKKVILVARNETKALQTSIQLHDADIATKIYLADVSRPREVLSAAREIVNNEPELHVCILNAGAWLTHPGRMLQEDGLEVHYATNYLQMVQFIEELKELVGSSGGGRFCVMGSFTGMTMAQGVLDLKHLRGAEGQSKLFPAEGGFCYSQTKLAQHVFCKHAATAADFLPVNVTLNVCCPGAVPTDIPGWQMWRDNLGVMFPVLSWCLGARSTSVGIQPMMHLAGAPSMSSQTGKFLDWGVYGRSVYHRPCGLECYPAQGSAKAPTTSDAVACKRLFDETLQLTAELRAKYPGPVPRPGL